MGGGKEGSEAMAEALTPSISSHTRDTGRGEQLYPLWACKEKGQWAVKVAAQQDITAVLTQHNNKFNFIKVS